MQKKTEMQEASLAFSEFLQELGESTRISWTNYETTKSVSNYRQDVSTMLSRNIFSISLISNNINSRAITNKHVYSWVFIKRLQIALVLRTRYFALFKKLARAC